MPVQFDCYGNPVPYSTISMDMVQFAFFSTIPDTSVRTTLFVRLIQYLQDFRRAVSPTTWIQWFGGSYTTNKPQPNDIDLVNLVDYDSVNSSLNVLPSFLTSTTVNPDSRQTYFIDGYLVPLFREDDPRLTITVDRIGYWTRWLGQDRDRNPRAIIEVKQ
jgi:hypothetical protein